VGFFAGQAASAAVFVYAMFRESWQDLLAAFRHLRLRATAYRYRHFAFFSTPSTLLNTLLVHLPVLMILPFFGEETVGYYGRALLGLAVPMNLIGVAVGQVFFVHAAEAHRAGTLGNLSGTVHARLVAVGVYPTLALLLAGPDVFGFVFGGEWRLSGEYVRYLGPWLMLAGIASPLTRLFDILEHQRLDLLMSVVLFVLQTTALAVGCLTGDVYRALLLLGIFGALARVLHLVVLLRIGGVPAGQALRPYVRYTLFALPCLLPVLAVLPLERPFVSTLAVAVGLACYGGLILWRDRLIAVR
jgi:O-antigen/teichoic acid export membrane protein